MSEAFTISTSPEHILEEIMYEYEVERPELIAQSLPLADRAMNLYRSDDGQIIAYYETPNCSGGSSLYSEEEVTVLGRGDYNKGLVRIVFTHCMAPLGNEGDIERLEE